MLVSEEPLIRRGKILSARERQRETERERAITQITIIIIKFSVQKDPGYKNKMRIYLNNFLCHRQTHSYFVLNFYLFFRRFLLCYKL